MGEIIHGLPFNVNDTSNATFTVQACPAGRLLRLRTLAFSASPTTTDSVTIKFGSRTIWGPIYCDGVTNGVFDLPEVRLQGLPSEDLKATKGSAGTLLTVYGIYYEE